MATIPGIQKAALAAVSAILLHGCSGSVEWSGSLDDFLTGQPERFGAAVQDPRTHRVQVIYTRIDRDEDNTPSFTSYTYRLDADEYFYPASTVKLPTALLSLEKLNDLGFEALNRDTTMLTGAADESQSPAISDRTSPSGLPSVGHYIRKILLVSDNDAFNRLYEFIGQQPLNEAMHAKGFEDTRIMHRLEIARTVEENQLTNPVVFVGDDAVVYEQAAVTSDVRFVAREQILLGKAEVVDGNLVERPKDFAEKNAYPLQDQHDVIKALMFPDSVPENRRFRLSEDDYRFVYRYMSMYPGESGIDDYSDAAKYPEGYVKFLMFGGDAADVPGNIRIFNKVGDAYGFLTDAAYVVDFENGVEFILAATVYSNENQTFNDNNYEYAEVGMPFLRELGQAIYDTELARPRQYAPDLSRFEIEY
jgi:hypothetical protein